MSTKTTKERENDPREAIKFDPYWTTHAGQNLTKAEYLAKCFREHDGFFRGAKVSRRR